MYNIQKALILLKQGDLVAFPTETVYGLGADARNPEALRKIFVAKQRPMDHPLIVHIADISQLATWASDISENALRLAQAFWPGPLTLILKKAPSVLDLITGNQDTIGLRIPNHPIAQALLKAFGDGLAAPSANRFGRISPTTAEAVREELGDAVDLILDGGQCEVGVESTIVDVSGERPMILRPGMITVEQIEQVLHVPISAPKKNAPRVSGSHELHYAPRTKTILIQAEQILKLLENLKESDLPVAVLARDARHCEAAKRLAVAIQDVQHGLPRPAKSAGLAMTPSSYENIYSVVMANNPKKYAHDLYRVLRELDKKNFKKIIIETVPDDHAWDALRDRLQRASGA